MSDSPLKAFGLEPPKPGATARLLSKMNHLTATTLAALAGDSFAFSLGGRLVLAGRSSIVPRDKGPSSCICPRASRSQPNGSCAPCRQTAEALRKPYPLPAIVRPPESRRAFLIR